MATKPSFRLWRCESRAYALVLLLSGLFFGSCNKNDDTAPPAPEPTIKLATSTTLGNYLTDKDGYTLYYFARDVDGPGTCTGGCAAQWPIFYEPDVQVSGDLQAADFGTQTAPNGQPQTTYKGWPLYYFAPPANGQNTREPAGAAQGNGVGTVWYVVNPAYSILVASKAVVDKSTNQSTTKSFLIDAKGRALYTFLKDDKNPGTFASNCTGTCETLWPPFFTTGRAMPSLLKATDFGTFGRATSTGGGPYGDGTATNQQLTYKGKPLYYFRADNQVRGRADGHGLVSEGDQWLLATP